MPDSKNDGFVQNLFRTLIPVVVGAALAIGSQLTIFHFQTQASADAKRYDILKEFVTVSLRANLIAPDAAEIKLALRRTAPSMDTETLTKYQSFTKERQKWALEQGIAAIMANSIFSLQIPANPRFTLLIVDKSVFEHSEAERRRAAEQISADLTSWSDQTIDFFKQVQQFAHDVAPH